MKLHKGQYGYRDNHRKQQLLWVILFLAAIIVQLLARYFTTSSSVKNILTVMAVLTVLPMANLASPLLAGWRYKTPAEDYHQKMVPYEEKCTILYDLIITSKEYVLPMDAVAVHPGAVIGYCTNPKVDVKKAEAYLNEMLKGNKLDANAKVIKEETTFLRRLENLKPATEYEDDGSLPYVIQLMKNLSM